MASEIFRVYVRGTKETYYFRSMNTIEHSIYVTWSRHPDGPPKITQIDDNWIVGDIHDPTLTIERVCSGKIRHTPTHF